MCSATRGRSAGSMRMSADGNVPTESSPARPSAACFASRRGMLDAGENILRLLQEDAPRVGQRDVLPASVEQLHSDRFLELTDLLAQRGLSRAKRAQPHV